MGLQIVHRYTEKVLSLETSKFEETTVFCSFLTIPYPSEDEMASFQLTASFLSLLILVVSNFDISKADTETFDELLVDDLEAEGRLSFYSGNSSSITPDYRAVLAFMLLGLLALVTFGPSLLGAFGGGSSNYGYNRNGFDYYDGGYQGYAEDGTQNQDQFYARSNVDDMVTKMLQLEQIFKKYEVEEDECKAYIACEAANVERLAENGPIVQKAHELFSAITKPEHLTKLKANKGMMIMKQAFDSAKTRQHEVDVCAPLRNACSALRQKTN